MENAPELKKQQVLRNMKHTLENAPPPRRQAQQPEVRVGEDFELRTPNCESSKHLWKLLSVNVSRPKK